MKRRQFIKQTLLAGAAIATGVALVKDILVGRIDHVRFIEPSVIDGERWSVDTQGGFMYSSELSDELRKDIKAVRFADLEHYPGPEMKDTDWTMDLEGNIKAILKKDARETLDQLDRETAKNLRMVEYGAFKRMRI